MRIGVPKEIKDNENRVGLTPDGVRSLATAGHEISVERGAGAGCGFLDRDYAAAGAHIGDVDSAWSSELVIKVKEPVGAELNRLRGQIVFGYLHLAGVSLELTKSLLTSNTTAIAYETVEDETGRFPLLAPMSAIAGSMAPGMGSYYLAHFNGGRGTLLGSVLGQRHGKVVIVGDGVVGRHAADAASGLGAEVLVFGVEPARAAPFARMTGVAWLKTSPESLAQHLTDADLLIGAVLHPGGRAPHVVTGAMVKTMPAGSVIVDVSIDQGGCVETSRATTHSDPVYTMYGVTHYCVSNMPGAYPRTATAALTSATLPYALELANGGIQAVRADAGFARGVNTHRGFITHRAVAEALGLLDRYQSLESLR